MATEQQRINKQSFLQRYGFTDKMFNTTGLEWTMLQEIYLRHLADVKRLQTTADYVSQRLREIPAVHSLKVRIKNPEHLLAKIIRKKHEKTDLPIDADNYSQYITDLIGIRAMHLFKDEWRPIHDFVTTTWEPKETPIAYVREGDSEAVEKAFSDCGCKVEKHAFGYRSVHYLLKSQAAKQLHLVELQVRTLFEEGWSEIDHQIRYPNLTDNPHLAEFLTIFNRLAGSADEMGTFIKALSQYVSEQEKKFSEQKKKVAEIETKLSKAISELDITHVEKEKLQEQVRELRESSQRAGKPFLTTNLLTNYVTMPTAVDLLTSPKLTNITSNLLGVSLLDRNCIKCGKTFKEELLSNNYYCAECLRK